MIFIKPLVKYSIIFTSITLGVGGLSVLFTRQNMDIYERINQPSFAPPSWLFPIVWGILYILMGFGAALVCTAPRRADKKPAAIFYFGLQLIVNFFWSIIFFNFQMFKASFVWLVFLLALILIMISAFGRVSKLSAYLQFPYAVWVLFAGILNLAIAILN